MQKSYLILENGKVFEGTSFGQAGTTIGELVFTTSMVGYSDLLTDSAYYGQIVVNTFPLVGNYGIVFDEFENKKPYLSGYIVREVCDNPSNFNCKCALEDYMKMHGLIGICDIDTRELTKIIRDNGTMNCMITDSKDNIDMDAIKNYKIRDAVKNTSMGVTECTSDGDCNVTVIDLGTKKEIETELSKRGCKTTVVKYDASENDILATNPDGIVITDGPGDPQDIAAITDSIKSILQRDIPVFGIGLGHQVLGIASGCKIVKLKYGHRGASQPVKSLEKGTVCITTQNHGYAIDTQSLPQGAIQSFVNVNDSTCEGISYSDKKAFSVQFHPAKSGGPHDTNYLYDKFIDMMKEDK